MASRRPMIVLFLVAGSTLRMAARHTRSLPVKAPPRRCACLPWPGPRIDGVHRRRRAVDVARPLAHVADHVVEAERVRRLLADGMRALGLLPAHHPAACTAASSLPV
jgi:hypothetical protein